LSGTIFFLCQLFPQREVFGYSTLLSFLCERQQLPADGPAIDHSSFISYTIDDVARDDGSAIFCAFNTGDKRLNVGECVSVDATVRQTFIQLHH
jgi:hypothetical protein